MARPATMPAINLPPDAEIVVNRLGESCLTVLVARTPRVDVEAQCDTATRLFQIWASALHRDGQRSLVFAVRQAPHVRGALAIVAGLVRCGVPWAEAKH